jgi:hypothetical protein
LSRKIRRLTLPQLSIPLERRPIPYQTKVADGIRQVVAETQAKYANQSVCGFSVIWFIEKKGNIAKRIVGTKAEQYHIQDNHTPDMLQTFPCIPKITSMPPHINCIGANLIMQKK